jgi:N6-L-threonylcarbamoyladenine synthase
VLVLGIETSCDETAAAVIADGREVRSNIIASQQAIHAAYGGVVPELACRSHIENLQPVIAAALEQAHVTLGEIDVFAVTHGPGLVGALLVGVSLAKALAYGLGKPSAVHHLEGILAFIQYPSLLICACGLGWALGSVLLSTTGTLHCARAHAR